MRLTTFLFAWLTLLAATVLAWEKEDHEIFDLVSALEGAEGKGTTFYSWLNVPPTATTSEISKAYRKMSMQLHPDKNPNVKGIHQRFARLGVVATILRNKESRKRYDFFYKNGVPSWRGTGYYYSRFRPGLGTVLVFLTFLTSALQLVAQRITYKRDKERMEMFTSEAKKAAWGTKLTPGEGQRKVKVNIGGRGDMGDERWIDMVVDGQDVYISDPSGDMHLLDPKTITYPTFGNTWFFSLVKSQVRKALNRGGNGGIASEDAQPSELSDSDDTSSIAGSESGRSSSNGRSSRGPAVKAGGRRRKAGPKKR